MRSGLYLRMFLVCVFNIVLLNVFKNMLCVVFDKRHSGHRDAQNPCSPQSITNILENMGGTPIDRSGDVTKRDASVKTRETLCHKGPKPRYVTRQQNPDEITEQTHQLRLVWGSISCQNSKPRWASHT